jgi:hypothetical protein
MKIKEEFHHKDTKGTKKEEGSVESNKKFVFFVWSVVKPLV